MDSMSFSDGHADIPSSKWLRFFFIFVHQVLLNYQFLKRQKRFKYVSAIRFRQGQGLPSRILECKVDAGTQG